MAVPLITKALSPRFGFNLGFLHWSGNWFAIHEVSLLALALFETTGLVKPSTLDAPSLISTFCGLKHREQLRDQLHPLHVIVHHEDLVAY